MFKSHVNGWYGFRLPNFHPDEDVNPDDLSILNDNDDNNQDNNEEQDDDKKDDNNDNTDDKKDEKEDENSDNKDDNNDEKEDDEEQQDDDKEDESEEDEEFDENEARVTQFADIKSKYPKFFKDFPDVRASLARESRYSEIFGSPNDAENAAKQANVLQNIEEDLLVKNDPAELITTIHKNSPEALEKVMFNLLPTLQEKHKDLYFEMMSVGIKQLCRNAWREGKGQTTNLGKAAAILHHYMFNNYDIDSKSKAEGAKVPEKTSREKELEERLNKIGENDFKKFTTSCTASYESKLTAKINERLEKYEGLSDYTKRNLIKDTISQINKALTKDSRYKASLDAALRYAKTNDYNNDAKARVVTTVLARAKSLVPETVKRLVAEANGKRKHDDNNDNKSERREFKPDNRNNNNRSSNRSSDKPKGQVTDLDILQGRA